GTYEGAFSAGSEDISDNEQAILELAVDVASAGTISFQYKVSSEGGWDSLGFYIDGSRQGSWDGEISWSLASFPVSAGPHTFTWKYEKDGSQSNGDDRAWIDYIVFPPLNINLTIETASLPDWTAGQSYSQQLEASGGIGGKTWTDKNGDLVGTGLTLTTGGLLSGIPTSDGPVQFTAEVTDGSKAVDEKLLGFTVNPVPEITTTDLPNGDVAEPYSQQLAATGGTAPLVWTDLYDDLTGTGLTLSSTGLLSGTPIEGTVSFTAQIEDIVGATDEALFSFDILMGCCISPSVGDLDQGGGVLGFNYDGADLSLMINGLFIDPANGWDSICLDEADVDFSSTRPVTDPLTVDGADLSLLIDALFVDPTHFLKNCDGSDNY
ncbi:MAG: hypothetical protein DRP45_11470, partial [Candidatus Zixiibacteriota bacterium]